MKHGFTIDSDLFKSRSHKYKKRTGSSGNYRYWYDDPANPGYLIDDETQQISGKGDHIRRLLVGRIKGKHAKTNKQIAEKVGIRPHRVNAYYQNMKTKGKATGKALGPEHNGDYSHHGHDYEDHHISEAHAPLRHEGASAPAAAPKPAAAAATPRPRRPRAPRRTDTERADARVAGARVPDHPATPVPAAAPRPAPAPAAPAAAPDLAAKLATARARVGRPADPAIVQRATDAAARVAARQSAEAMATSSPASPESKDLSAADPSFAASESGLREMLEVQRTGGNPYLNRAKDIFHNIQHDIKASRKEVIKHMFSAMDAIKHAGQPLNAATLTAKYKEVSGKNIQGVSTIAKEFESGTFMTLDEVMNNHPINVEVERMKRGFAAKQFLRLKPFLNAEFAASHPSAPPPYPTYNDLKSWDEHGGAEPSWATSPSRVQKAMPKEFYDSMHKGPDGKPQMPPGWLPLHLSPVWNYVAKEHHGKTGESGPLAYSSTQLSPHAAAQRGAMRGGKVALPNQDTGQSILERSMRKYIQMRGGPDQLVDIPSSKLTEIGITHSDIFRSEGGEMYQVAKTKIIDPVGLLKVVKEEMSKPMKKSWALTIDLDSSSVDFKKSYVVQSDIRKSMIEKLRSSKREKARS